MADLLSIDAVKIEALCEQFHSEIKPLLQSRGRNHIAPVANYIYEMATTKKRTKPDKLAEKIINYARNSRNVALKLWASDTRVIHLENAPIKVAAAVEYYRARAALNEQELTALNKMIKK